MCCFRLGGGRIGSTEFDVFLSALRNNNLLRVLAEPNLSTVSGKEAEFLAGGEFPIPVSRGKTRSASSSSSSASASPSSRRCWRPTGFRCASGPR